jgi:hypothetical protein
VRHAKAKRQRIVVHNGFACGTMFCRYSIASVPETTAVATYDLEKAEKRKGGFGKEYKRVRHAAKDATNFVVVFRRRLYDPPLRGSADTASV